MIDRSLAKLEGYRRRIVHEWQMARFRADHRRKKNVLYRWLSQLRTHPPEVLVGPNFAEYGGVRHHIEAIVRNSILNVELAPPAELTSILTPYDFSETFREEFMAYRADGIRVLHSHVFPSFIDWCTERQKDGIRWVHTYHLNYYPEHSNGNLEPWQAEINETLIKKARHADQCLSVSKWQVKELRELYGIESTYLPNGVDVSLSRRANPARFIRTYRLEEFILYVGRDDPVKNPGEFAKLAAAMPDRTHVMIGHGINAQTLATRYGIEAPRNLVFLGGLSQQNVQDAIAACRVLVVTSRREGLPTLVMEGMALGKPIVVPNEPGCMEAIGEGEAGYIYELGNINDLVEKSILAWSDEAIGPAAQERVLREYDWRVVSKRLDQIYMT